MGWWFWGPSLNTKHTLCKHHSLSLIRIIDVYSDQTMFRSCLLVVLIVATLVSATPTVTLSVNQTAKICRGAKLQVKSIQDSRWPADAMGIWQGQAKVQLRLTSKEGSSDAELIISAQAKSNALVTVGSKVYNVTLKNFIPYPGTSSDPSRAVIDIICP